MLREIAHYAKGSLSGRSSLRAKSIFWELLGGLWEMKRNGKTRAADSEQCRSKRTVPLRGKYVLRWSAVAVCAPGGGVVGIPGRAR